MQGKLREMIRNEEPIKDIVNAIIEDVNKNSLQDHDVVVMVSTSYAFINQMGHGSKFIISCVPWANGNYLRASENFTITLFNVILYMPNLNT